jgi:type II secretory pathway component PulJ
MRAAPLRRRGMTIVEVTVSIALCAAVVGLGVKLSSSSLTDSNQMYVRTALQIHAADATDIVARELQTATLTGEDGNGNRTLDTGEDTNRNGRLDADWSLADGSLATAITFNLPVDGWLWSGPITYYVNNGTLMRRENGVDREICRSVTTFQVTRTGNLVDINLTLTSKDRAHRTWTETSSRRAHVRN